MATEKFVALQLIGRTRKGPVVAIVKIQRRWDPVINKPELYPGGCHVTLKCEVKNLESDKSVLFREAEKELGEEIVPILRSIDHLGQMPQLFTINNQTIFYGAVVDEEVWQKLVAKERSLYYGGFKEVPPNHHIIELDKSREHGGIKDKGIVAMPADEKEAVLLAFEILKI